MRLKILSLTLVLSSISLIVNAQVLTGSLSLSTMSSCDTAVATISGYYCCGNSMLTGNSHSINGTVITINVSSTCPTICLPSLVIWNTTYKLGGIPAGSYSVKYAYNNFASSTISSNLTVQNSSQAMAGNDTTVCDATSLVLNGNNPPASITGSWSVVSGSASFSNSSLPNASVTNLGYGINVLEWTINDPSCATSDQVKITNDETPSFAITEVNRRSCYDSTTIKANAITSGIGKWNVVTPGVSVPVKNTPNTKAYNLVLGQNLFEWTVNGKSCGIERDTLKILYEVYTDTPSITANGSLLTSSTAPFYQWYFNGIEIVGATGQSFLATANGMYKVLTGFQECDNGLFSDEFEVLYAGVNASVKANFTLSPNPGNGQITINLDRNYQSVQLTLSDLSGRLLNEWSFENKNNISLDMNQPSGMYLLGIQADEVLTVEKLVIE